MLPRPYTLECTQQPLVSGTVLHSCSVQLYSLMVVLQKPEFQGLGEYSLCSSRCEMLNGTIHFDLGLNSQFMKTIAAR